MIYVNNSTINIGIYGWDTSNILSTFTGSSYSGSYIGTFNSTPLKSWYKNYSSLSTLQTNSVTPGGSAILPNQPYFIMVLNLNGSPYSGQYYTGRNQFAFMGEYLTPTEVEEIDSIINTFQTTLGRNTY